MPLLGPDDPLPVVPRRVTVNGASGAGKSTLARKIAAVLDLPYTEIDGLFHGPGWVPRAEFLAVVEALTAAERWVCEFQYDAARPLMLARAELMVWLDTPSWRLLGRVSRRTVSRRMHRTELWNGNREGPLSEALTDPDHVVRYAWRTRGDASSRVRDLLRTHPGLPVVHLRHPREVDRWLRGPLVAPT
jgi:adenylate kinase family enzyme